MEFSAETVQAFILDELEQFRADGQIPANTDLSGGTGLFAADGILKSRPLVELLLAIEEHVDTAHGMAFDWTSDKAMSATNSPFRTVTSLAEFVVEASTA